MTTTPSEAHTPLRLVRHDADEYPKFCPGDARIVGPDNICYGILFGALEQVREPQDAFIAAVNERPKLLARVKRLEDALERAMEHISRTPHDDHCFTNDPNPDACCCVCGKDTELEMANDVLIALKAE